MRRQAVTLSLLLALACFSACAPDPAPSLDARVATLERRLADVERENAALRERLSDLSRHDASSAARAAQPRGYANEHADAVLGLEAPIDARVARRAR